MEQRQAGGESLNAFLHCTLNLGHVPEVVQKGYLSSSEILANFPDYQGPRTG